MKSWLEENVLWLKATGGIASIAGFLKSFLDKKKSSEQEMDIGGKNTKLSQTQNADDGPKSQKAKIRGEGHDLQQKQ